MEKEAFRTGLITWYARQHRPLPWKELRDPYVIWLSEIILQQTRVEQGLPYFERFLAKYPSVETLAAAPLDEVMKQWEGLGYYSRARNLHETARRIALERKGRFPETYEEILALKGVGPYTAAAIASFAYGLPHAVVDGNVFRVLARVFGIDLPIDSAAGRKRFQTLARRLLDPTRPGRYNQAIMDFGATCCTPRQPACPSCPFQNQCIARRDNRIDELPVKAPKAARRLRFFHYLVAHWGDEVFLQKRTGKDIWQGLFEFPLIEQDDAACNPADLLQHPQWPRWILPSAGLIGQISAPFQQTLSHQVVTAIFWSLTLRQEPQTEDYPLIRTNRKNLTKFAFPRIIDWYLRDNSLNLI